jgi:hypothetical protein
MIPTHKIWNINQQESLFEKSSNIMRLSIIQSDKSMQGKHFNFLDSSGGNFAFGPQ